MSSGHRAATVATIAAIVAVAAAIVSVAVPALRGSGPLAPVARRLQPWRPRFLVVCLGDSITSFGYPAVVSGLLGREYRVSNEGVSGETSAQILGRWRFGIRETRPDVLVLLAGLNDLQLGTGRAAPAVANLRQLVLEADEAGTRVIPVTVLPFRGALSWAPDLEQERGTINRALLELCARHPHAACLDASAAMSQGDALRPEFDTGDHVHLSEAGNARLAQLVAERVRAVTAGR